MLLLLPLILSGEGSDGEGEVGGVGSKESGSGDVLIGPQERK